MTSFVTGQKVFASQLNTAFSQCFPAGGVSAYSATLLSNATQGLWLASLGLPFAGPGAAFGLATLDSGAKVPLTQIPASLVGAMYPQGGWNANTNNPALASGVGTKGFFYVVTTAGATVLDGNNTWSLGDCLFFDGTIWRKINGSGNVSIPSTNISDSTAVGRAILTAGSVPAQRALLNIDQAQIVVDTNQTITNVMEAVAWSSISAPRTGTIPLGSSCNPGQVIFIYDESGNCSATNTITLNASGSDTIAGLASYVLNRAYAGVALIRASVAKWTPFPFSLVNPPPIWTAQPLSVRQTVISGPVDANGLPTFLPTSSASLAITSQNITASTPLVVSAADGAMLGGQTDATGLTTTNISWSALTANTTNYLGVSVSAAGALTPLVTILRPIYQQGGTPSVTNGQLTFVISLMTMYLGNGATATPYNAVMVAEVVTGASTVTSVTPYAYNGIFDSTYTATLPSAGLNVINHNLGIIPNVCEIFIKNTTAEASYSLGDIVFGRGVMTSAGNSAFILNPTSTTLNLIAGTNYGLLNKTTGAGATLTAANWSWRTRAVRGW